MSAAWCLTQYAGQACGRRSFRHRLEKPGHPDLPPLPHRRAIPPISSLIVSEEGFGKNDYIETTRPARGRHRPGPRQRQDGHLPFPALPRVQARHQGRATPSLRPSPSGTCRSSTRSTWPMRRPRRICSDVNMIDPFHLEAYGETTVNYNRDVEIFPVLQRHLSRASTAIAPTSPPPTWASTWRATASWTTKSAARPRFRRLSCAATMRQPATDIKGEADMEEDAMYRMELVMSSGRRRHSQMRSDCVPARPGPRPRTPARPATAIELEDGTIVTGKTSPRCLGPPPPRCSTPSNISRELTTPPC